MLVNLYLIASLLEVRPPYGLLDRFTEGPLH